MDQIWPWVGFNAFVLAMLALDLGVFHRKAQAVSLREAATRSAVWVALALAFNAGIYHALGEQAGLSFLAGYLVEKALSVDNVFILVLIIAYFRVPPKDRHRVLFWGILGVLVMRGIMIGQGTYLVHRFDWVLDIFGTFLVWTGYRVARQDGRAIEPEANPVIRLVPRGQLMTCPSGPWHPDDSTSALNRGRRKAWLYSRSSRRSWSDEVRSRSSW